MPSFAQIREARERRRLERLAIAAKRANRYVSPLSAYDIAESRRPVVIDRVLHRRAIAFFMGLDQRRPTSLLISSPPVIMPETDPELEDFEEISRKWGLVRRARAMPAYSLHKKKIEADKARQERREAKERQRMAYRCPGCDRPRSDWEDIYTYWGAVLARFCSSSCATKCWWERKLLGHPNSKEFTQWRVARKLFEVQSGLARHKDWRSSRRLRELQKEESQARRLLSP